MMCSLFFTELENPVPSASSCAQESFQIQVCGHSTKHFLLSMLSGCVGCGCLEAGVIDSGLNMCMLLVYVLKVLITIIEDDMFYILSLSVHNESIKK